MLAFTNQEKPGFRPVRMPAAGGKSEILLAAESSLDGGPVYSFDGRV